MDYKDIHLETQEDLKILHSAFVLKWSSLAEQIKDSTSKENVAFYCRSLVRVLEILRYIEDCDD